MKVNFKQALQKLRNGEVVAVPTETVYGVAAYVFNEEAILKLYNLKKRTLKKPIVIQLAHSDQLTDFLDLVPYDLEKLLHRFWPGPLTLVLPVIEAKVPGILRAHLPTCAFRVSENKDLRELISQYGPLAITSANESGEGELENPKEIEAFFGDDFPILDAKAPSLSGIPSMVLAYIDASWVILRKGNIHLKELRSTLGYNPPVAAEIDQANNTYSIDPQIYPMEKEYDGSIEVVVGFEDRQYHGAQKVIHIGTTSKPLKAKEAILKVMGALQREKHPHVWVDLNLPKTGFFKEFAQILERSCKFES